MTTTILTATDLLEMSQAELDTLYQRSPTGPIPDGDSKGSAIIGPGSLSSKILVPVIRLLAWKGKVFHAQQAYLLNKITPFGLRQIKAQIYRDKSWIDSQEAIILDYSQTSFVAQKIRDEIREISPGLYLGQAYWGKTRVLNFVLEF